MVESFFEFKHKPFERDIPPEAMLQTNDFKNLRSRLDHAVKNNCFMIVTGSAGCGKTTAIRSFTAGLDSSHNTVLYVSESGLTPRNFYYTLLNQLGVRPHFYRGDAKRQLMKEILAISGNRKQVAIIIDEAHFCNFEMLTEIRFLLNFNYDSHNPMALVLVGQPELRSTLKRPVYEAIAQRVELCCHIQNLDLVGTCDYVAAHLKYAADKQVDIFTDSALRAIFDYSGGLPRKINRVASFCLTHAAQNSKRLIEAEMVSVIVDNELIYGG